MRLQSVDIENFKSLQRVSCTFDEFVTVFIGKNNSGKSNVIDALSFVATLFQSSSLESAIKPRGSYDDVVFQKNTNPAVIIKLALRFLLSEEEVKNLASIFQLEGDSLKAFVNRFGKNVDYCVKLGQPECYPRIIEEIVTVTFAGKEIAYAFAKDNATSIYQYQIVESVKNGVQKNDWTTKIEGGQTPPAPFLSNFLPTRRILRPEHSLLAILAEHITSFRNLSPVRESGENQKVVGQYQISPDCGNLPQVLNTLASSRRKTFDLIVKRASEIIGEMNEIRPFMIDGSDDTTLSLTENWAPGIEFRWRNISSGMKEVLYLLTFLQTTPRGSILVLEEPELHLHNESLLGFRKVVEEVSRDESKQVLITTHSATLIDDFPWSRIRLVVKEKGATQIISLEDNEPLDEILVNAGIPKSWILLLRLPSFIALVEGRDDVKILSQFFKNNGIDLERSKVRIVAGSREEVGGESEATKLAEFLKRTRSPTPFLLILDSDGKKEEKTARLNKILKPDEFYVLSVKEIEDYLIDEETIANVTGKEVSSVRKAIIDAKGAGKEKLEKVFKTLGLSCPNSEVKEILASRTKTPEEISAIIGLVKKKLA